MVMKTLATGLLLAIATPAHAAEDVLLDLSTPENVAAALQEAGYKAKIEKADDGSRYILSAANGNGFTVDLTDCKALKCAGLSIQSFYKAEPYFNLAMANEWNQNNRFLRVSLDEKGQLREWLDIDTFGKLTKANFGDLIDWYITMDGNLAKFVKAKDDAAKAKK